MAFIQGIVLIDAPASALNGGEGEDTKSTVKKIRVGMQEYPYVSAQSFRFWLRTSIERNFPEWQAAPVYTAGKGKKQQAYTEGDPIQYWDDDLLGYMRAEKSETVTRVSPFRTSTLVSVGPATIVDDFGVMARFENDTDREGVVLHGHEFYRTVLQGMFSLDLSAAGTFTDQNRTGFKNLGTATREAAQERNLAYSEDEKAYRLPTDDRVRRVQTLLRGLARVEGGAKLTLHYTPVAPSFVLAAVTRGGNNMFGHVIQQKRGEAQVNGDALQQALSVFQDEFLSPIYVGRAEGFMDESHQTLTEALNIDSIAHPRQTLDMLADDLAANPQWMD